MFLEKFDHTLLCEVFKYLAHGTGTQETICLKFSRFDLSPLFNYGNTFAVSKQTGKKIFNYVLAFAIKV